MKYLVIYWDDYGDGVWQVYTWTSSKKRAIKEAAKVNSSHVKVVKVETLREWKY